MTELDALAFSYRLSEELYEGWNFPPALGEEVRALSDAERADPILYVRSICKATIKDLKGQGDGDPDMEAVLAPVCAFVADVWASIKHYGFDEAVVDAVAFRTAVEIV